MVCANGTTAGEYKKDLSEQECAEYCWSLPECNAWSFYNFGNGYCYPYAASDCIERNEGWFWDHASWGSASCGAPKGNKVFKFQASSQAKRKLSRFDHDLHLTQTPYLTLIRRY